MTTPVLTRILFATDFSANARCAQEYAIYLAGAWNAALDVLHVIETPHLARVDTKSFARVGRARTTAARQLEEVRDDLARRGVSAKVRLVLGNPTEHICLVARDNGAKLIVLGMPGFNSPEYGLIGRTTEGVFKDAPCPVLAVPGDQEDVARTPSTGEARLIRNILAPLDFSSPSLDAVEFAVHLAQGVGAALTLMHVLEPACHDLDFGLGMIEQETSKRAYWNRQLMELREVITGFGVAADLEISGGLPSDAILACALRHHADLIVMGTHGRRGVTSERFGSVAEAVLCRATCPVVTVKTPRFEPGHRRVVPHVLGSQEIKGVKP